MKLLWVAMSAVLFLGPNGEDAMTSPSTLQPLPAPKLTGRLSLEQAIAARRSVREFAGKPLSLEQIGQLCWAGQGITDQQQGLRAAPSAGALYPIELYVATAEGVGRYRPDRHSLQPHLAGDHRPALRRAALDQESITSAPVCMIITAVVDRTVGKYGKRADRYCLIEAGHVAQNILLQATALQLAGVPIGAFDDEKLTEALKLPKGHQVLYLLPIGRP